jgi:hypothetical protein
MAISRLVAVARCRAWPGVRNPDNRRFENMALTVCGSRLDEWGFARISLQQVRCLVEFKIAKTSSLAEIRPSVCVRVWRSGMEGLQLPSAPAAAECNVVSDLKSSESVATVAASLVWFCVTGAS